MVFFKAGILGVVTKAEGGKEYKDTLLLLLILAFRGKWRKKGNLNAHAVLKLHLLALLLLLVCV